MEDVNKILRACLCMVNKSNKAIAPLGTGQGMKITF
jgi:hypothetical protein